MRVPRTGRTNRTNGQVFLKKLKAGLTSTPVEGALQRSMVSLTSVQCFDRFSDPVLQKQIGRISTLGCSFAKTQIATTTYAISKTTDWMLTKMVI